jgi:hypothetical protein
MMMTSLANPWPVDDGWLATASAFESGVAVVFDGAD